MAEENLPRGIVIFTTEEVLTHKMLDGKEEDGNYVYWETSKRPIKFIDEDWELCEEFVIYFAVKGQIKGYFIVNDSQQGELDFNSESWKPIMNGEVLKPAQGWRYYPKDK